MLNKVTLIGRIGRDPELKYTAAGDAVASISLATTEKWKDQNGQKQEKTEWHRCIAFKRAAEILQQYTAKGSLIYIEGKLTTKEWQDKQGVKKKTTEIIVNDFKLLGGGLGESGSRNPESQEQKPERLSYNTASFDDEIPF